MKIKFKDSPDNTSLCADCLHSHIIVHDNSEKFVYCQALSWAGVPYVIPRKVTKCSNYDEKKGVSLWDMRQIAWVIRTDKSGHIGFTPYRDLTKKGKEEIDELC